MIPQAYINEWRTDVEAVFTSIKKTNDQIAAGNLHHLEDMLINQAHALESIFYSYAEKMLSTAYPSHMQAYSDIALKAQKQCRNTVMAIVDLKNPKQTLFVKQQNNAMNQQVNSSENIIISSNELLEKNDDPVESRTSITAIPNHSSLAAMAKINRSEDAQGEKQVQDERV